MGNRCNQGKSCGATCINRGKSCEVTLGQQINQNLSKAKTAIERVEARLSPMAAHNVNWTPLEAAKWLLNNEDRLQRFEIDPEGGPKTAWFVGQEPGATLDTVQRDFPSTWQKMVESNPAFAKMSKGEYQQYLLDHPEYLVRGQKNWFEVTKVIGRETGKKVNTGFDRKDPVLIEQLNRGEVPKGLRTEGILKEVAAKRWSPGTYVAKAGRALKASGMEEAHFLNPSILSAPGEKWPYKKLFQDAGLPVPTRYKTRQEWMKHSLQTRGRILEEQIRSKKPEVVYFGGAFNRALFDKLAGGGKVRTEVVKWESKSGAPQETEFRSVQLGPTRLILGPHFNSQQNNAVWRMQEKLMRGE